eukprot:m.215567 g.215567  ORF g.215567 m.215567 type:complete len:103 (-) comp19103_c0_seq2:1809-2117(-)
MPWACPCISGQPAETVQKKRPKIDRSMIGEPTNFQHTSHIGSTDMSTSAMTLKDIGLQMNSKGGHVDEAKVPKGESAVTTAIPITDEGADTGDDSGNAADTS